MLHEVALLVMIGMFSLHFLGLFKIGYIAGLVICALAAVTAHSLSRGRKDLQAHNLAMEDRQTLLHHEATSDPLTRLANRMAFNRALDEQTNGRAPGDLAILFFDLDNFKEVNDALGHKVGDLLLIEVARRLSALLRDGYVLARVGGDEFAAIAPANDAHRPEDLAVAIIEAIGQPFLIDDHSVQIGTSVGIAIGSRSSGDGETLLKQADIAMYEAKKRRQGYRLFDTELQAKMTARTGIRQEIAQAIEDDLLSQSYQPIINPRTGEMESVEALLRWRSPTLGEISPGTLVPIVEESGQIIELSNWTIDKAIAAIDRLGVPVGINISPVHFRHHGFVGMIADKLLAAGVPADMLHIEITEGVLISHMDAAKRTIGQLRDMGAKVFLDDFGTGYSSLSYLQTFDLDGMKIDKSFLRDLGQRNHATQIMRAVINLGHSLGMKVVAEGVENDWQARLLSLLNCDLLQGYYLATPMPLDEVIAFRETRPVKPVAVADPAGQPLSAVPDATLPLP